MQTMRRKQFILPQEKLTAVKKALGTKTETEAVILSLEAVLRQRKLDAFADLPRRIRLSIGLDDLERMRGR